MSRRVKRLDVFYSGCSRYERSPEGFPVAPDGRKNAYSRDSHIDHMQSTFSEKKRKNRSPQEPRSRLSMQKYLYPFYPRSSTPSESALGGESLSLPPDCWFRPGKLPQRYPPAIIKMKLHHTIHGQKVAEWLTAESHRVELRNRSCLTDSGLLLQFSECEVPRWPPGEMTARFIRAFPC